MVEFKYFYIIIKLNKILIFYYKSINQIIDGYRLQVEIIKRNKTTTQEVINQNVRFKEEINRTRF